MQKMREVTAFVKKGSVMNFSPDYLGDLSFLAKRFDKMATEADERTLWDRCQYVAEKYGRDVQSVFNDMIELVVEHHFY